jgi:hypothetical protein
MSSYPDYPRGNPIISKFSILEEEVDSTFRPAVLPMTIAKQTMSAYPLAQFCKQSVKLFEVITAVHIVRLPFLMSARTV